MRLPKALSLIPFAFGSILSVSASEYKFENIKFLTDIGYKARGYINREDILLVYE